MVDWNAASEGCVNPAKRGKPGSLIDKGNCKMGETSLSSRSNYVANRVFCSRIYNKFLGHAHGAANGLLVGYLLEKLQNLIIKASGENKVYTFCVGVSMGRKCFASLCDKW